VPARFKLHANEYEARAEESGKRVTYGTATTTELRFIHGIRRNWRLLLQEGGQKSRGLQIIMYLTVRGDGASALTTTQRRDGGQNLWFD
jgi:hypothetical protein